MPLKAAAAYEQVAKRIANFPSIVSAENLLVPLPTRPSGSVPPMQYYNDETELYIYIWEV